MPQKEYSDTLSRNSLPHGHDTSPRQTCSGISDVQCDTGNPGVHRNDRTVHTGELSNGGKPSGLTWFTALCRGFKIGHLISLLLYGSFGLSSREKDNYTGIFVYGGSIITFISYFVLYCADINKLTSSIFEKRQGESTGTHWAKAGLMGVVLPVFDFIGFIVMFEKVGQDRKTFWSGIIAFILYLLGNTLLLLKKGKSESEEHELRDNNPPADNSTADNAVMDNSPAANLSVFNSPADNSTADNAVVDNSPAANSPAANSPAANSSVDNSPTVDAPATNSLIDNSSVDYSPAANSPAANSPAANSSVDNSPTVDAPATNSLIDNSSVDYSPANNSLRPSICTFP